MKPSKLQHRVTRTRVKVSKLLEFGVFYCPLWIRRVLVRAQEGQWLPRQREPFLLGLVLQRLRRLRLEPNAGASAPATRGNWKGPRYFTGVGPSIFLP
jgi:hypothetical protein